MDMIKDVFEKLLLFLGISYESLENYLHDCRIIEMSDGQILVSPEKSNNEVYILLDGSLSVHLESPENPPQFKLELGECIGELSIIDHENPSAYVVVDGHARLLSIDHDQLWKMADVFHELTINLLMTLSKRLRTNTKVIANSMEMRRQIEEVAMIDHLTGLHNRRWLDEILKRQLNRSLREGSPLTLIMADIDHFKSFNDQYGHQAGDKVLASVAKTMRERLRPNDMIARYGGEEFAVLLPKTNIQNGLVVAERLRKGVHDTLFHNNEGETMLSITISLGLAEAASDSTAQSLISSADKALYRAKNNGRNRSSF